MQYDDLDQDVTDLDEEKVEFVRPMTQLEWQVQKALKKHGGKSHFAQLAKVCRSAGACYVRTILTQLVAGLQTTKEAMSDAQLARVNVGAGSGASTSGLPVGGGVGDFGRAVIKQLIEQGHDPVAMLGAALRDSVASTASYATSGGEDDSDDDSEDDSEDDEDEGDADEDENSGEDSDELELSGGGERVVSVGSRSGRSVSDGKVAAVSDTSEEEEDEEDSDESDEDTDEDDDEDTSESDSDNDELELSMDESTILVKWIAGEQVRKAILRRDIRFSKLRRRVAREYEKGMQMAYLDEEDGALRSEYTRGT